jgi:hypothetical protein
MGKTMKTFYCTFGMGTRLHDNYVRIEAETHKEVIDKMYNEYGSMWSICYPEEKMDCILRWGLIEVPFGTPNATGRNNCPNPLGENNGNT